MRVPEGFLNARQAAEYVGYEPGAGPSGRDPQMRAFYEFVRRHGVPKHQRGRCLLFKPLELDQAIGRSTADHEEAHLTSLERMAEAGRQHAAGGGLRLTR